LKHIDSSQVDHIAILSRLSLTEEERTVFGSQLNDILEYVRKLEELDTSEIQPTSHVLELSNVFREDRLASSLTADEVLANAPDRAEDFYRVPKIIEQ
jgi:aspartyl-tRNA(Asn)/glutamyl-tRNA(Gln) amidotransferase subunit C